MGNAPGERITQAPGLEICQRENIRRLIVFRYTQVRNEYALSSKLIDSRPDETVRFCFGRFHGLRRFSARVAEVT